MKKLIRIIIIVAINLLSILTVYASINHATIKSDPGIEQWSEANEIFRMDPHWKGSDGAYSIKIGTNRVLWLFGDTLISSQNKILSRDPKYIKMPRNSIGIQTGINPTNGTIQYYWGNNCNTTYPDAFFTNVDIPKEHWLWPGDGVLLSDNKTLVIFFMDIMPSESGFGFDVAGYQVAIIKNSDVSPQNWKINWAKKLSLYEPLKILIGSGGVLVEGDYIYAYGYSSADYTQSVYLARWHIELFKKTDNLDLSNPEWWCGEEYGWIDNANISDEKQPVALWDHGQTEFTVTKIYPENPKKSFFMMTQAYPENQVLGNSDLLVRTSKSLTGPWSDTKILYHKLCRDDPAPTDLLVYAGKLHPDLVGDELIFTYATNTMNITTLWDWDNIYYPRFLKGDELYKILLESEARQFKV